jgi:hypothetical protein
MMRSVLEWLRRRVLSLRSLLDSLRRRSLALWQMRGGGFYSLVAVCTFLWWQVTGTVALILHPRLPDFGLGWIVGRFLARLGLDFVWALLWPLAWLGRFGPPKALLLFLVALAAYKLLRPRILPFLEAPPG